MKTHLHPQGMCVCNMKTIRVTVSETSSGNEKHGRTAGQVDMLTTISPDIRGIMEMLKTVIDVS